MEATGQVIIDLHRNLQELRASIDANPNSRERALLQGTLEQAEAALRAQAAELVRASRAAPGRSPSAPTKGLPAPAAAPGAHPRPPPPPHQWPARGPVPAVGVAAAASRDDAVRRQRPLRAPVGGARARGKDAQAQRQLPRPNRLDPLAEEELGRGLLNLGMRGYADMAPHMERGLPLTHKQAPLYDQAQKRERREISTQEANYAIRLDLREPPAPSRLRGLAAPAPGGSGRRLASESPRSRQQRLPPLQAAPSGASSPPAESQMLALAAPPAAAPPGPGAYSAYAGGSVAESYGTFCTELFDAAPSEPLAFVQVGPTDDEVRGAAATKLAAAWRGARQRREYAEAVAADRAARRIQLAWIAATTRMRTRAELHRLREEEKKLHTRRMYDLGQDWFQIKRERRVEVHICSLTVSEARRWKMGSFQALQTAQLGRIFRLSDPKRDIVFVAPKFLHEDILQYYSSIMQFRGVKNPPGRFQVVVPENTDLAPNMSLSQALLCSPKALRRVRKLVAGRQACVVPDTVTAAELRLCGQLGLPMLGPASRNTALLSSKSNGKKLAQLAELPTGPWAVDIYDEDELLSSLAGMIVRHPDVQVWLLKIDDERDGRGLAYVDLAKMREVADAARYCKAAVPPSTEAEAAPALLGSEASEVRAMLHKYLPKRVTLCCKHAYPDWATWLQEASRVGAVLQAVPNSMVSQCSVHLSIEPDGNTQVTGTSEAVCHQPFLRAASWYPHTRGDWEVLHEVGARMGRVLAAKGLVGFASVDVVFFDNPYFDPAAAEREGRSPSPVVIGSDTPVDPASLMFEGLRSPSPDMTSTSSADGDRPHCPASQQMPSLPGSALSMYETDMEARGSRRPRGTASLMLGEAPTFEASPASPLGCWVVDVDARLTDEAAALFPIQFIAQVRTEPSTGLLQLTGEAREAEESERQPDGPERPLHRWALVSRIVSAPGIEKMSYQSLFQAVKMRGVSFDLFHNVGCIFSFLDVFQSLFAFMAVERTPEHCAKRLSAATAAAAEVGPRHQMAASGIGRDEARDGLTSIDLQAALRMELRRWPEAPGGSVAAA